MRCTCGMELKRNSAGLVHVGLPPAGWEYHPPEIEIAKGRSDPPEPERPPGERLADAAERIADALERVVERLYR